MRWARIALEGATQVFFQLVTPSPYDTRDEIEHAEIAALLEQLTPTHPAREAYGRGAGTIELTHLVADRAELVDEPKEAFLAG